jgi:copper(I)-binding protein
MRLVILALAALLGTAPPALAQHQHGQGMVAEAAWARATPGTSKEGAVYLRLVNHGAIADRLLSVSTPAAASAEPHETTIDNGIARMRPLNALTLAPEQVMEFKPGGAHIMLMGLKQPLKQGDSFPLTLTFEKAGTVQTTVAVERMGARGPSMDEHQMHGMDHGAMHQ